MHESTVSVDPERLLTLQDVADLTQVSVRTVRRQIARGDLRAIRIGRTIRVRSSDYHAFLDQASSHASAPLRLSGEVLPAYMSGGFVFKPKLA